MAMLNQTPDNCKLNCLLFVLSLPPQPMRTKRTLFIPNSNSQWHAIARKIEQTCKGRHKNIGELQKCKPCMQLEQLINEELTQQL